MSLIKKFQVEAAKEAAELATKTLKANEILWMDKWNSAPNPFVAISNYRSSHQRKKRKPIIDAWLSAVAAYDAIKPKNGAVA